MQPIKNNKETHEKCASQSVSVLIDFQITSNCALNQIMLKLIKFYFESMLCVCEVAQESQGRGWIPLALGESITNKYIVFFAMFCTWKASNQKYEIVFRGKQIK